MAADRNVDATARIERWPEVVGDLPILIFAGDEKQPATYSERA